MKLNTNASIKTNIENHPDLTTNYEGGIAFNMDANTRLYSRVASCLVSEPKYYKEINEDGTVDFNQDKLLLKDIQEVAKTDPEFILKLAKYTRNVLNLRTISIVLLVEASLIKECKKYIRKYTPLIIKRADELTEAVAYLQKKIGHLGNKATKGSMPSALKKGLADSFNNFDSYQLSKYNRKGFVKLKDVLKLTHPVPKNEEQSLIFKKLKEDTLESPDTWEVVISTKGSTKENWEAIAPKMPIFATVRNLRNFLEKEVDLKPILESFYNENIIKNSKMLPFRFFSAYREVEQITNPNTTKVLDALENAMDLSVENLPKLNGTTLIISDNSGSMDSPLSEHSTVRLKDISNLMLAISHKICDSSYNMVFGDSIALVNLSGRSGTINNKKLIDLEGQKVGCSTNAYKAIQYLNTTGTKIDRIIIFSDMQCYNSGESYYSLSNNYAYSVASELKKYKSSINPNVFCYSIDLAGYGTLQIPQDETRTCLIAGWSERILEYINLFEQDNKQVIERIKNGT